MTIGLRAAGGFAISLTERSPYTVSASVRGIGVAVMCSTCGARPSDERLPLLDAEPVLLVDHGHREARQLDVLLDQRVRADDEVRIGIALHRAGEQRDADAELRAQRLDRQEVLLGERLGRRHQRALA